MRRKLRVWARSPDLDRRLAEGVWPTNSPELALRAKQLSSARARRQLSGTLTAAVEEARSPRPPWSARAPIVMTEVRRAASLLERLAEDLVTVVEPRVRGVALVSFLVCDPGSPLYNRRSPVTVGEMAERARAALAPA
jgi:hypothetical protein